MNISVLGPGRWGSFIAWYQNKIGNNVKLWGLSHNAVFQNFMATRKNDYVTLPDSIEMTTDLIDAVTTADYIIISINSQGVRELMGKISQIENYNQKKYIICMKGVEDVTGARISTILIDAGIDENNIATWVGPGHIQSFVEGIPSCMVIDSYNSELSAELVNKFKSELIKFYQGNDMIGTEIGAAAKNVIGIAAGLLDGMNYSTLKGSLMARGAYEISKLIEACGGNASSAYGLCHLGDYEATLFSQYSHNRMFGEMFAKGEFFDKPAEGVATSSALLALAKNVDVDLPITKAVYDIIHNNISKEKALKQLFDINTTKEFHKKW